MIDLVFKHSAKFSIETSVPFSMNSVLRGGPFYRSSWTNVVDIDKGINWMKWERMSHN